MRYKKIILFCIGTIILTGCTQRAPKQTTIEQSTETISMESTETASVKLIIEPSLETESTEPILTQSTEITEIAPTTKESVETKSELITENSIDAEPSFPEQSFDETVYIGEYLDSAVQEPNLEIAKGEDNSYIIQIGIYRLTFLSDGVGTLTAEGMNFTATDASGNPISGVITVEGETAIVTFTNSTWEYLENGSTFQYTKSSNIPNIWMME